MLLREAIFKLKVNEMFDPGIGLNKIVYDPDDGIVWKKSRLAVTLEQVRENGHINGEIISTLADPEVLNIEKLTEKICDDLDSEEKEWLLGDLIRNAVKISRKNFRLERNNEIKPVFDRIKILEYYIENPSAWDYFSQNVSDQLAELRKDFLNLPSLE